MLLVVRVLLLVEVPQTIGLVHKRFPRLLVQFLPPANIQSVFKIQNQCELKIHLLALFLLILPPLSLSTPLSSVSHFLRTYFPAGTTSAPCYLPGHSNPLPSIAESAYVQFSLCRCVLLRYLRPKFSQLLFLPHNLDQMWRSWRNASLG